jgi:hypothetical protein
LTLPPSSGRAAIGEPEIVSHSHSPDSLGLAAFRDFLVPQPLVDDLISANKQRIAAAHPRAAVCVREEAAEASFYFRMKSLIADMSDSLPLLSVAVYRLRQIRLDSAARRAVPRGRRCLEGRCSLVDGYTARRRAESGAARARRGVGAGQAAFRRGAQGGMRARCCSMGRRGRPPASLI